MKVTYIYHDCFLISFPDCCLLTDYFQAPAIEMNDGMPWFVSLIEPDKPLYVLVSHHHKDHFSTAVFDLANKFPDTTFILSKDTAKSIAYMLKENSTYRGAHKVNRDRVVVLRPGESVQLPHIKVDAFASTDIGNSYVVSTAQIRLFFAGDLNAWIWKDESTKKEIEAAIRDFKAILMTVREKYSEFDIAFFPVDPRLGRDFWEGAAIFSQEFKIHNLVPMHFEWGVTPEEQEYFYTSVASAPWLKDSDCNYVPLFRNDTYTL